MVGAKRSGVKKTVEPQRHGGTEKAEINWTGYLSRFGRSWRQRQLRRFRRAGERFFGVIGPGMLRRRGCNSRIAAECFLAGNRIRMGWRFPQADLGEAPIIRFIHERIRR